MLLSLLSLLSRRTLRGRGRRTAASVALVATLSVGLGACGGGATAYRGVVVGTCRGFVSGGSSVHDVALLRRASEEWHHEGGAMAQPVPVPPPVGPVCAIDAHELGGRTVVTLADASHTATYEESPTGERRILTAGPLPDSTPRTLPVIAVGDGLWQLAATVTAAEVWVGVPDGAHDVTSVRPGRPVAVDALVTRFAAGHPGALPHLLIVASAGGTLYAATGGAPYAASYDEVLVAGLGVDDAATRGGWETVLRGGGVMQVAQAVASTSRGAQAPQRVDRLLTLVGSVQSRTVGTVVVVKEEPDDGSHLATQVVTVVQRRGRGAEATPVGGIVSPSGSWATGVWLSPVGAGTGDPRELLLMGEPGTSGGSVSLEATSGEQRAVVAGPLGLVTAGQLPAFGSASTRPAIVVRGATESRIVLPLGPVP